MLIAPNLKQSEKGANSESWRLSEVSHCNRSLTFGQLAAVFATLSTFRMFHPRLVPDALWCSINCRSFANFWDRLLTILMNRPRSVYMVEFKERGVAEPT